MTVSAGTAKAGPYTGNDTVSAFAFSFKTFSDGDIRVVMLDEDTSVETDLVLNTDYTVTRNGDQDTSPGGTVTYKVGGVTTALPSGKRLTIVGDFDYAQPTDLPNGGSFFASVVENALDRVTLLIKQIKERVDNALTLPVSVSGVSTELPVPAANRVIGWNSAGNALVNLNAEDLATSIVGANKTVDTFSGDGVTTTFTLSATPSTENNTLVFISGVYQQKSQYSVTGTQLTFTSAPPSGSNNIEVEQFEAVSYPVVALATNAVDTAALQDGSVTTAKIADGSVTLAKWASGLLLDEDDMATDSDSAVPSQQSVKAYVDTQVATKNIATQVTPGAEGNVLVSDGSAWVSAGVPVFAGSAQAVNTLSSVSFTSIPSGVKRLTVVLNRVSLSGTEIPRIRIGTGGTPATSGYESGASDAAANTITDNGFNLARSGGAVASDSYSGVVTLMKIDASTNTWVMSGAVVRYGSGDTAAVAGSIALAGELDVLQILPSGPNTFDGSGSVNIAWG